MTLKKSQKKDLKQMELKLQTSSQEVSPVNRSRSQANKKEQVTIDIFGLRCFESSKSLSRGGLLEKMSKVLLTSKTAWSSRLCALTWKEKDTKSGRSIFQLQVSAPPTEEKGSGLWRTPDAHCDRGPSSEKRMKMKLEKKMPISINDQIAHPNLMWPTPTVNDSKNNAGPSQFKRKGTNLNVAVAKRGTQGGSLNPTWVEWLMGYPVEYTDLKHWEILSSRKSRKK